MTADKSGLGRSLDAVNFFLADVRDGLGPYLAIYLLTEQKWEEASIGLVRPMAAIAGIGLGILAGLHMYVTGVLRNHYGIDNFGELLVAMGYTSGLSLNETVFDPGYWYITTQEAQWGGWVMQKLGIDNGDGTFTYYEGNQGNPILSGNTSLFNNALSMSVFAGRTTALQIYLNDAILNHDGVNLTWDRTLFQTVNTNPTTGKITGFLSDYLMFDISNVAAKPSMQSPDALGQDAQRFYISGDAFALSQAPDADPTVPKVLDFYEAVYQRPSDAASDLFSDPLAPLETKDFDAVVLDPPRAGAKAQCERLARSKIKRVMMVSCNPVTLARDLRILFDGGYRLDAISPIDQFVYSPHLEAVAALSR